MDVVAASLANNWPIWWIAQVIAVAILVALFLRWRPGFLNGRTIGETVGSALDAREQGIRAQLQAAEESRKEAARIREEAAREIDRAREESKQIVSRAENTSAAIQEEMVRRAEEEKERIIGQASAEIDYERRQAELALRRRAAEIVVDAARQVVRENLDASGDRQIIEHSLTRVKDLQ